MQYSSAFFLFEDSAVWRESVSDSTCWLRWSLDSTAGSGWPKGLPRVSIFVYIRMLLLTVPVLSEHLTMASTWSDSAT